MPRTIIINNATVKSKACLVILYLSKARSLVSGARLIAYYFVGNRTLCTIYYYYSLLSPVIQVRDDSHTSSYTWCVSFCLHCFTLRVVCLPNSSPAAISEGGCGYGGIMLERWRDQIEW
jgi:hypothetical protein